MDIQAAPAQICQLAITLTGVEPPIWRRLELPATITLAQLHRAIQVAMGWYDSHLHQFTLGDLAYGVLHAESWQDVQDEAAVRLVELLREPGQQMLYEYDLGDGWAHQLVLEQLRAAEPGASYPRCSAGARACPPEDCGGVRGYAYLLEVIRDAAHPEHADMIAWLGGAFDPEAFDLAEVNQLLGALG